MITRASMKRLLLIGACIFLFSSSIMGVVQSDTSFEEEPIRVIRVAMYVGDGDELWVSNIFQYQWQANGQLFCFEPTIIYAEDVLGYGPHPLNRDHFDILVVGASARSYILHGLSSAWKEHVRSFVASGGGYIGMCAGSILASCGIEQPSSAFHQLINANALGISNVYIYEDFFGELQYVLKNGFSFDKWTQPENKTAGYVDVNTSVVHDASNVIFSSYDKNYCHLTYAGGPGMVPTDTKDALFSDLQPLLLYNEELMHTKPIHYYRPTASGWDIWKNVSTNLLDSYAGVSNSYGDGRVVLFGPHPELILTLNGTIYEYLDRGLSLYLPKFIAPPQFVFSYIGEMASYTNHWMMRRSAAWAAGLSEDLFPPIDDLKITVVRPWTFTKVVYINDKGLGENLSSRMVMVPKVREKDQVSLVVGDLTVIAYSQHCDMDMKVDFYVDDIWVETVKPAFSDPQLQAIAYQITITEPLVGFHKLTFSIEDEFGNRAWDSIEALFLNF
jgi:glutamine amidotransferase-like uncharacterized protein